MSMSEQELGRDETLRLISSSKVAGTAVYNADDEKIGQIEKLMIDKAGGRVSFAVMSFGGFLGIGEQHYPIPWDKLVYDPDLDGYIVAIRREELEQAPRMEPGEEPPQGDLDWNDSVRLYYRGIGGAAMI